MAEPVLRIVNTFDGTPSLKGHCKFIKGEYYEINRQCYLMPDGKWHRVNNGLIVFDHRSKTWKLKNETYGMTQGIIGGTPENLEVGYFTSTGEDLICVYKGRQLRLLDDKLIKELDLAEDISNGTYVSKLEWGTTKNYVGKKKVYPYPLKLDYNSENSLGYHIGKFNKEGLVGSLDFFKDEIEDITFGMEIETWGGTVNYKHLSKVGIIPLKDGSLRHDGVEAYEYATIPLSGGKGLYTLKNAFDVLQIYTDISKYCSLHLHIGGYRRSKEFILSTYNTIKELENELYSLFPAFYEDTSKFKQKNYCGHLPKLNLSLDTDEAFEEFYRFFSMGNEFEGFSNQNHPSDPGGNAKWNIDTRYYLVNFVSFLWGNRETIEFRLHPPTLNPVKAINWLFICNAILRYSNLNKKDWFNLKGSKITLEQVFTTVYNETLSSYLCNYIDSLKANRKIYDSIGDGQGDTWCRNDLKFTFTGQELLTNLFEECPI